MATYFSSIGNIIILMNIGFDVCSRSNFSDKADKQKETDKLIENYIGSQNILLNQYHG